MGEHYHGIVLHLSAYPPVCEVEVLVNTAVKSMEFFVRNSNIKFVFPEIKKSGKSKNNVTELLSKVKNKFKKISFGGIMNKLKFKKNDKFSNVKLEYMNNQDEEANQKNSLELIEFTLEVLRGLIEK